jgi:hypothetical protein
MAVLVEPAARAASTPRAATSRAGRPVAGTVVALVLWTALVAIAVAWGEHVVAVGDRLRIHAPPLAGDYRTRAGLVLLAPIGVALLVVAAGPVVARRARWSTVVVAAMGAAVAWAIVLGLNDGAAGLTGPLLPGQYLRTVPKVGDPLTFLSTFTDRIATYNIHTQGHPPGMVLVLWGLDRVGLRGTGPNLALVLAGGGASIGAALVCLRDVAGEQRARAAAPFLALAPAAIWWSSGDALFAGVAGWAATCVVVATGRRGARADVLAALGGLLFGAAAMLSYGLVLVAAIPVVVAVARRRLRPLAVAAGAAALVLLAFAPLGFWWPEGLGATRVRYWAGVASRRPAGYFLVGNLAAFALALGPAAAIGLARLRDRGTWLLVGGALVAVALADLSGMSKAEVERIWLPFVPWVLLATTALALTRRPGVTTRLALLVQAALAITIQATVRSPW